MVSSFCLWSRDHAWPVGVSCHLAGVRSSAYKLVLDPPPQIYPYMGCWEVKNVRGRKESRQIVVGEDGRKKKREGEQTRGIENAAKAE